jgi:spoIIIJ-associated protein
MSDRTETLETSEQDYLEISPEAVDEIADMSIEFLEEILKYFEIGDVTIDEYEGDEGELILDITGDNLAILIGRHGNTLSALQTLLSSVILRKVGFRYPVIIDVEG